MDTEILTRAPQIALARGSGPAVGAHYINPDDILRIGINCSVPAVQVKAVARILTPDGKVTPSLWLLIAIGDRANQEIDVRVPEGWLLSFGMSTTSAAVPYGACFTRAHLIRGGPLTAFPAVELVAGYIFSGFYQAWPLSVPEPPIRYRGALRSIAGTDPAAGVEISETVPTMALWRLRAVRYQLVTSAVAGNRASSLVIDDGVNTITVLDPPATQAASLTYNYSWAPFGSRAVAIGSDQQCMLPGDLVLPAGYRFRTATTAKDAGDNYGPPQYLVEEWITPW